MSKLAKYRHPTSRALRAAAGLALTAAVLIAFAANQGPQPPGPSQAVRPTTQMDSRHGAPRRATRVSPGPAARDFVSTYVSFLYGWLAANAVAPVARALSRRLLDGRSTATPAELSRELVVRDLVVTPRAGTAATAQAVVDDGASPPYGLSFNLTLTHRHWLVTAVETSGR